MTWIVIFAILAALVIVLVALGLCKAAAKADKQIDEWRKRGYH